MKRQVIIIGLLSLIVGVLIGSTYSRKSTQYLSREVIVNQPQRPDESAKKSIELNVYNAELTRIEDKPSAPLAEGIEVDIPTNSCMEFKYIDPLSLHDTLFAGCNSERDKPLLHITEVANGNKRMNVFGEYDYTDCSAGVEECVVNMIINRIELIN